LKITVNGDDKDMADEIVISDLIIELGLKAERLAVEVNRRIVRRADWPSTTLKEGDKVEIVHFVGGGAA